MYLSFRLSIADADHPDASPLSPLSLDESSVLWYKKLTKSILRQTNFEYSVALQRGHSLVLQFSVYQHDVGFSAYFSSQSEGVALFLAFDAQNQPNVEMIELQPYKYVLSSAGHCNYVFTAPSNGSISLCWDNYYSYFTQQRSARSLI